MRYIFKRLVIVAAATVLFLAKTYAEEGMWVPLFLKNIEADMRAKGLRLTGDDIYHINETSLKDAVVIFGGGCTGEVVSPNGLIFTNHHCGYGQIQYHSSLEHDYLTNGFWANSFEEELPCPGLKVTFLNRMQDVTDEVLGGLAETLSEAERRDSISSRIKAIKKSIEDTSHYKVNIDPFYYGNNYYMFVNEVFEDVRLVGTPPSNIGKFGGDTDNWMWPRHTGDFSVFRIYAGKDNKPAPYSAENVPYEAKYYFKISTKGIEEGDFTFVFGYPGRTQEYISSYAVKHITEVENPIRIENRTRRLNVIKAAMEASPKTRIQYSAKAASIANGHKKQIGENRGVKRLKTIENKEKFEAEFEKWTQSNEGSKYQGLLDQIKEAYAQIMPYSVMSVLYSEVGMASELVKMANSFSVLVELAQAESTTDSIWVAKLEEKKGKLSDFFKDYDIEVDRQIFMSLLPKEGDTTSETAFIEPDNYVIKNLYSKSMFSSQKKLEELLSLEFDKRDVFAAKCQKDVAYKYASLLSSQFTNITRPNVRTLNSKIDSLQRLYMKAQMEMQSNKNFYPDANFTLRIAYGNVKGFTPADGVYYDPFTTIDGIMEKENPDIYDYVVEDKLKELYVNKDFEPYTDAQGRLPVAFIASNHTTGGNSGSPVLNSEGYLIGLNFDRNWEGTMSDINYDPDMCRNICLDIRYCLFIIDKFAGAKRLIDELSILR